MSERWQNIARNIAGKAFEAATAPLFCCTIFAFPKNQQVSEPITLQEGSYQEAIKKTGPNGEHIIIVPSGAEVEFEVEGQIVTVNDYKRRYPKRNGDVVIDAGSSRQRITDWHQVKSLLFPLTGYVIYVPYEDSLQHIEKTLAKKLPFKE